MLGGLYTHYAKVNTIWKRRRFRYIARFGLVSRQSGSGFGGGEGQARNEKATAAEASFGWPQLRLLCGSAKAVALRLRPGQAGSVLSGAMRYFVGHVGQERRVTMIEPMGDGHAHGHTTTLRVVDYPDAMTTYWSRLTREVLEQISNANRKRGFRSQPGRLRYRLEAAEHDRMGITVPRLKASPKGLEG